LDLSLNNLQEIHEDILDPLTELIILDLGNNRWKCDCDVVEVLNWFSERRKSQGLAGEHRPVRCVEEGVYRTIWTAANRNKSCTKQSRAISTTVISTESAQILQRKEYEEESPTAGGWRGELLSWNNVLVFIILPLKLGVAVFVALVGVNCFVNYMNYRRQCTESKVSKNKTESSKVYFFSRIPSFSSPISSDPFAEKYGRHSVISIEDRSNSYDSYHLYERISQTIPFDEIL
jgi:hypothetical protein